MKTKMFAVFAAAIALVSPSPAFSNSHVTLQTPLGDVEIELFDDQAPQTVANFLNYVNDGDYQNTFVHRSEPGFVIQGGGYSFLNGTVYNVPADDPVANEPGVSNLRGTIAMAKRGGDPDSATSQWYINLADNSNPLDADNGGYTVFGQVVGDGMDIIDQIVALEVWAFNAPFGSLPLIDYDGGLSALGYVAPEPAPQCIDRPWTNREKRGCGLGYELVLLLPGLMCLRQRTGER